MKAEMDSWGSKFCKILENSKSKCVGVQIRDPTYLLCVVAPSPLPVVDTADGQDKRQAEAPGQPTHLKIVWLENRKYFTSSGHRSPTDISN